MAYSQKKKRGISITWFSRLQLLGSLRVHIGVHIEYYEQ